ncbi:hypothetical protein R6242_21595 [Iodobacter sp. CM08]|uniref:hypothetical protein n=1 Tax=Iodobacter sp. CM08 TaxID=3085902 RepID=UPI0029821331|nr:hypothetical protein [Iodobacter sp. CM08]MDW5419172.1 hypothetical protein [Iodobacter sp. CM08]
MKIFGVYLNKPMGLDVAMMVFWGVVGGLVSMLVLMPLIGGDWKHGIGMMASSAIGGLAATCGASFDKSGVRGLLLTVAITTLVYGLIVILL